MTSEHIFIHDKSSKVKMRIIRVFFHAQKSCWLAFNICVLPKKYLVWYNHSNRHAPYNLVWNIGKFNKKFFMQIKSKQFRLADDHLNFSGWDDCVRKSSFPACQILILYQKIITAYLKFHVFINLLHILFHTRLKSYFAPNKFRVSLF